MQSDIQIIRHAARCRIDIEGTIGVPEQEQFDPGSRQVATWERFRRTVEEIRRISDPEVIVNIRSTGGDVNDALLIHDALRSLGGRITTRCYGYTASAATVIAQAASPGCRELSANALYLIHRSVCASEGNADELAARLDLLRKTDERLAEVYAARSGRAKADFEALMGENNGNGRWLSPREAIAAGLADRIVAFEEGIPQADLVVLATPVDTIPLMAVKALNRVNGSQVVMDLGSIKAELCEVISMHARRGRFVAAHPM